MISIRSRIAAAAACAILVVFGVLVRAAVRPPRMAYELLKLPNGLTVVLLEDHSTPIVYAQVWYHVGSKDERAGRTGFAHLFEHLMFKGSKNVDAEQHSSTISSVGGMSTAYTTESVSSSRGNPMSRVRRGSHRAPTARARNAEPRHGSIYPAFFFSSLSTRTGLGKSSLFGC